MSGNFYCERERHPGSYLYMLLCQDDGPIHIKVGMTDRPTKRLSGLVACAPATPQLFCFLEVWSREIAQIMETELLAALRGWQTRGEWFTVPASDRAAFNDAWKPVLKVRMRDGWPMVWNQVAVEAVRRAGRQKRAYVRYLYKKRGRSYRDFVKDWWNAR